MKTAILFILAASFAWGQTTRQDTSSATPLPQIQLQEYTITGLAKIKLPRKIRTRSFKMVDIRWTTNPDIEQKEPPGIAFQFSNVKPSLLRQSAFTRLDFRAHGGSYTTADAAFNAQLQSGRWLPYISAAFHRDDGHLKNAQRTAGEVQAGIHYQPAKGHRWQAGSSFSNSRQGVWPADRNWEMNTARWKSFIRLDQQWNRRIGSSISGTYFRDEQKNILHVSDRAYRGEAGANLDWQTTRLETGAELEHSELNFESGNLASQRTACVAFPAYRADLIGAHVSVQQRWQVITLYAGLRWQQLKEKPIKKNSEEENRDALSPALGAVIALPGKIKLQANYAPHLAVTRLRSLWNVLPFSDVQTLAAANYKKNWHLTASWNPSEKFNLTLGGRWAEIEDYTAPLTAADSLPVNFSSGKYPGWAFGVLDRVDLRELHATLRAAPAEGFSATLQTSYRRSEILQHPFAVGKEIPYLPRFAGWAEIAWRLAAGHELALTADVRGRRFDDPANLTELAAFTLLNARLEVAVSSRVRFYLLGKNLLNVDYQEWLRFNAPGINGYGGIRMVF